MGDGRSGYHLGGRNPKKTFLLGILHFSRRNHYFPSVDICVIVANVDNNNFRGDAFVCGGLLGLC